MKRRIQAHQATGGKFTFVSHWITSDEHSKVVCHVCWLTRDWEKEQACIAVEELQQDLSQIQLHNRILRIIEASDVDVADLSCALACDPSLKTCCESEFGLPVAAAEWDELNTLVSRWCKHAESSGSYLDLPSIFEKVRTHISFYMTFGKTWAELIKKHLKVQHSCRPFAALLDEEHMTTKEIIDTWSRYLENWDVMKELHELDQGFPKPLTRACCQQLTNVIMVFRPVLTAIGHQGQQAPQASQVFPVFKGLSNYYKAKKDMPKPPNYDLWMDQEVMEDERVEFDLISTVGQQAHKWISDAMKTFIASIEDNEVCTKTLLVSSFLDPRFKSNERYASEVQMTSVKSQIKQAGDRTKEQLAKIAMTDLVPAIRAPSKRVAKAVYPQPKKKVKTVAREDFPGANQSMQDEVLYPEESPPLIERLFSRVTNWLSQSQSQL